MATCSRVNMYYVHQLLDLTLYAFVVKVATNLHNTTVFLGSLHNYESREGPGVIEVILDWK